MNLSAASPRGNGCPTMKKLVLFLLCFLLSAQVFAADSEEIDVFFPEGADDRQALLAALFEADISTLRETIDLGLISCRELTEYYLERIETYNETYNCFITLCDNALDVADARDAALADGTAEGALFGIPVVVKDNIDFEGYPTTNGYWYYKSECTESATVVQYLLDEGAIVLGMTNMSAGAQDAICSVSDRVLETFNAYDAELASGGSSGGSAAAVSLNFAVAGLGTDTNVSLRYPSALNGCVALRPTVGLLERDGCVILNHSRDTAGAITRGVKDQAIMLDVLTGGAHGYAEKLDANALDGMRIGVLSELSYPLPGSYDRGADNLDAEICAAFDNAVAELTSCGAEVVTVSMPEVFSYVASMGDSNTDLREAMYAKVTALMEESGVSVLIFPTYLHTPHYSVTKHPSSSYPYVCNCATLSPLTGAPEITIPIGTHSLGAGIGLEIFAPREEEQLLLDVAYSYTTRYDHRQAPENAPSLYVSGEALTLDEYIDRVRERSETSQALETVALQPVSDAPQEVLLDVTVTVPEPETLHDAQTEKQERNAPPLLYLLPAAAVAAAAIVLWRRRRRQRQEVT